MLYLWLVYIIYKIKTCICVKNRGCSNTYPITVTIVDFTRREHHGDNKLTINIGGTSTD